MTRSSTQSSMPASHPWPGPPLRVQCLLPTPDLVLHSKFYACFLPLIRSFTQSYMSQNTITTRTFNKFVPASHPWPGPPLKVLWVRTPSPRGHSINSCLLPTPDQVLYSKFYESEHHHHEDIQWICGPWSFWEPNRWGYCFLLCVGCANYVHTNYW